MSGHTPKPAPMADAKHTPGPWKLEGNWNVDAKPIGGWVSTVHPSPLFELTPLTGAPEAIIANARLIAAAPDLKDGTAMSTAEMISAIAVLRELGREDIASRLSAQCDFNRAAIAKATGVA